MANKAFDPPGGLRAALRRAMAGPRASPRTPAPGPLAVYEECFGGDSGYPGDLFGEDFHWECKRGSQLAFLDVETCGLGDAPIFLIGILKPQDSGVRLWRVFARDPSGEPALIRKASEILGRDPVWVTFNGRSFDGPRLRRRAGHHGIDFPSPAEHQDLLLAVRRRYGRELPNCKLGTVERRLLGLERRADDVPGREVPERYWDFVRSGDYRWIKPVLEHNRRDVTAMTVLYQRLREEGIF